VGERGLLASASRDGTVKLWSALAAGNGATFKGHTKSVMQLAFAPDGNVW